MKENGEIDPKKIKLNENKLEFLFLKLKDAKIHNSYLEKHKEDNTMASLKEYAASIFAEDVDKETNCSSTADDKHAAEQSGVSPEIGGPEDVKVAADSVNEEMLPGTAGSADHEPVPGTDPKPSAEEPWEDAEPPLDEKDQDKVVSEALDALAEEVETEGHAGFGPEDTPEKPPVEFEVSEKELQEAIAAIREEVSLQEVENLEPSDAKADDGPMEEAKPEGGEDPSHEKLDEMHLPMSEEDDAPVDDIVSVDEPVVEDEPVLGDEDVDADLVLHLDLPDEVEAALADVSPADVQVSVSDVNSADELEGVPGEEPALPPVDGGDELPPVGAEEEEEEGGEPELDDLMQEKALYEAKLKRAASVLKEYKGQVSTLKSELREANLFLAKNVYFTRFLQRGDLSKENLTKIAEHLDRAATVKEAKAIYGKLKNKLNESIAASKQLAGSSSKVTMPGSAVKLNESKQQQQQNSSEEQLVSRWQKLANIKK